MYFATAAQEAANSSAWNHVFNFSDEVRLEGGHATAVALPHSRECIEEPMSALPNIVPGTRYQCKKSEREQNYGLYHRKTSEVQ